MEINRWLKITLLTGLWSVLFVPFVIATDMFFPFITGKNFAFRIIVELLAAGTVVLALRDPAYRPKFSWISMGVLSLMAAATLATLFSVEPTKSFWSNFERMEGLIGTLHLGLWFFIAAILLSTEKLWERFLQTSLGASFIMACYGLMQIGGLIGINQSGTRIDGTFGNSIYMAVYMLFHIFLGLYLAFRWKGARLVYWVYGAAVFIDILALYFTATRSATLGLIGGLMVAGLGIGLFDRSRPQLRKWAIGALVAIGLIVIGFFSVRNLEYVQTDPVLSRFATISFTERTIISRFMIWGMALEGVKENPVLGWGQENFSYVFNKYYNPQMYQQEQWFDRAHNAFIDWLIAGGLIALLAFVSLFALAAWAFFKAPGLSTAERAVLLGLLSAYAFHSFFVFDNLVSSIYFFLLLALAHSFTRRALPSSIALTRPVTGAAFWGGSAAAVAAGLAAVFYLNMPGIANAKDLIAAISSSKVERNALGQEVQVAKDPKESLEAFKSVAVDFPLGRQETIEQLFQTTAAIAQNQNVSPDVRMAFADLAYERGLKMLEERPNDARLELFMGAFLDQVGAYDKALPHLLKARELSPNKHWIMFELAINNYAQSGNTAKAVETAKQAFDLTPHYREARMFYAMALILHGEQAKADALLTEGFGTTVINDNRLLNAYVQTKQFARAAAIWKLRAEATPDDIQTLVSYAVAQKEAGDLPGAIATLRVAAQRAPQYREQIESIATQLGGTL